MIFLPDLLVDNQLINCWFSFKKIDSLDEKANSKRGMDLYEGGVELS
ncbi:MAG: hypothetical protein SPH41_04790 [Bacilli bacterium]|nr:hypothetical protein [Bacilli bacterium]MDY5248981.1 hypothetical protein [Bacilli bacterium]MDY5898835.1 hypothetical protein [Bacilli bacterium]MDY6048212.1 hypothetical protein [Bacilli bacterium]